MLKLDPSTRSARTRAKLERALMRLIETKSYEEISVKAICEAANVGRSTFYAHFGGKDDVKRSGLAHLREALVAHTAAARGTPGSMFAFSLPLLEHARRHASFYRALVRNRGGRIALAKIREIVAELVRWDVAGPASGKLGATQRELVVVHIVGAYMSLLTSWLDAGAHLAPRAVDATFRRLSIDGLRWLGESPDDA